MTTEKKPSPAAKRVIAAAKLLHRDDNEKWQSPFARIVDISPSYVRHIASGERPLTPELEAKIADAIEKEANRLRTVADRLDDIVAKMRRD